MQFAWRNSAVVILTLLGLVGTSCVAGQHQLPSQRQTVGPTSPASTATMPTKVQARSSQLPLHFQVRRRVPGQDHWQSSDVSCRLARPEVVRLRVE